MPLPIVTAPVLPELVEPEVNESKPLIPPVTAFDVFTTIAPDVVAVDEPEVTVTAPPVVAPVPDANVSAPPKPLRPAPTEMLMAPPRPIVARPDPIEMAPLLPDFEYPLANANDPLTPFVPASLLLITMEPLVVTAPTPDAMDNKPPV
jgi:hypothetical protein